MSYLNYMYDFLLYKAKFYVHGCGIIDAEILRELLIKDLKNNFNI